MTAPIRWALLSTARINERILPELRRSGRSHVMAVASRDRERARTYAAQNEIPKAYGSYAELCGDESIDAVYISLPNSLHAEWCVKLAAAGKHVLCEKPLALSQAEVEDIITAAEGSGVVIQEALGMRFHPQTALVRSLIQSGEIGEVRLVRGWFSFTLRAEADIRLDPELGGGSLWDLGCYPITLFRATLGVDPIEVFGWSTGESAQVDLTFAGQIRYANGVRAQIGTSMTSVPSWGAEFLGSRGRIQLSHPWLNRIGSEAEVTIWRAGSGTAADTFGDDPDHLVVGVKRFENVNAYAEEVAAFEATLLDGREPTFPLEESRTNVATAAALLASAQGNRSVML
jgi:D-xylose 1-dehydrogenase (NADP+, D-xylono-1,5-lactone-forming)